MAVKDKFLDEAELTPEMALALASTRVRKYRGKKVYMVSTPTQPTSWIEDRFLRKR